MRRLWVTVLLKELLIRAKFATFTLTPKCYQMKATLFKLVTPCVVSSPLYSHELPPTEATLSQLFRLKQQNIIRTHFAQDVHIIRRLVVIAGFCTLRFLSLLAFKHVKRDLPVWQREWTSRKLVI